MLTFTDDLKILGTAIKYLDSFDSKLKLKSYRSRIRFRCGFGFRMRMLPTFFQIVDALNIHYFHHIIVGWFSRRYSNPFPDLFLAVEAAAAVATAAAGAAAIVLVDWDDPADFFSGGYRFVAIGCLVLMILSSNQGTSSRNMIQSECFVKGAIFWLPCSFHCSHSTLSDRERFLLKGDYFPFHLKFFEISQDSTYFLRVLLVTSIGIER